jgi:hypothetical protein
MMAAGRPPRGRPAADHETMVAIKQDDEEATDGAG